MPEMPQARKSGLIVKEVDNEILIYDLESHQAHCLNQTAAQIWKHCDGRTTVAQARSFLSRDLDTPVDDKLIWYAIDQFSRDHLLQDGSAMPPSTVAGLNRRQMVRALGLSAMIALPLVTTIIAPIAARAASCPQPPGSVGSGDPCCADSECASGNCCLSDGDCPGGEPIETCL